MLEPRGVTFLRPVWEMITDDGWRGLGLNLDDVDIYYRKYINNFKRTPTEREESIEQAVDKKLTPGLN